jgi:hypothetical protein
MAVILRVGLTVFVAAACIALSFPWQVGTALRAQASELTFDLKIEKGRLPQNKRLIRVRQGDAVRLRWSSDRAIILHLHGYDIETKVEPGASAEMTFTARATGRFPVEEHKPEAQGGHSHGEAPLLRIEVLPP